MAAFARAVVPATVGGLLILGFTAWPVFTGNGFKYRDAFGLEVAKVSRPEGGFLVEGVLEIRKPGRYKVVATRFVFPEMLPAGGMDSGLNEGKITWGAAGEPKDGATGKYPLQVRWEKTAGHPEIPAPEMVPFMNMAALEVRDPSAPGILLRSVPIPLPEEAK